MKDKANHWWGSGYKETPINSHMENNNIKNQIKNNTLKVKTIPNASKTEIKKIQEGVLHITVAAPPEKGKANKELLRFLKKELNITVHIKSGAASREKIIYIY